MFFFARKEKSPIIADNQLTKNLALRKAVCNGFLDLPAQVDTQRRLYQEYIFPQEEVKDSALQIPFVYTEENNGD